MRFRESPLLSLTVKLTNEFQVLAFITHYQPQEMRGVQGGGLLLYGVSTTGLERVRAQRGLQSLVGLREKTSVLRLSLKFSPLLTSTLSPTRSQTERHPWSATYR